MAKYIITMPVCYKKALENDTFGSHKWDWIFRELCKIAKPYEEPEEAEWKDYYFMGQREGLECSKCHNVVDFYRFPYCPWCGRKMKIAPCGGRRGLGVIDD